MGNQLLNEHDRHRPARRPRRLRRSEVIRRMVRETRLTPDRLILPLFIVDGTDVVEPIEAIPGRRKMSIDRTIAECEDAMELGVKSFAIFPDTPSELKTAEAAEALNPGNIVCRAIVAMKRELPEACVITDIALDPYSSLGHDGLVSEAGEILNDETVEVLAEMAVLHAEAGADVVAPSDMMDGRVGAIRNALDEKGFTNTLILAYTAKYASALYGPFRTALHSAPVEQANVPRDKKTYQMDPANIREASIEMELDEAEGADMLMVKPASWYLDVIAQLRAESALPIAAYHVSGEFAMVKAAAARGWLDERESMTEVLTSIARAGADVILTYAALDFARWCRE